MGVTRPTGYARCLGDLLAWPGKSVLHGCRRYSRSDTQGGAHNTTKAKDSLGAELIPVSSKDLLDNDVDDALTSTSLSGGKTASSVVCSALRVGETESVERPSDCACDPVQSRARREMLAGCCCPGRKDTLLAAEQHPVPE
eukprot:4152995-Prymnesium_polylepis.1